MPGVFPWPSITGLPLLCCNLCLLYNIPGLVCPSVLLACFWQVSVVHGDLRDVDLSDATVVVMYLLPDAMADIAQSHLLPLLRRGHGTPATTTTTSFPLPGDSETQRVEGQTVESEGAAVSTRGGEEEGRLNGGCGNDGGGVGGGMKPCRIVCNTWGVPGATAVREAGVGLHGGVNLRLFTHASLPSSA